jgi:hypothetical protein
MKYHLCIDETGQFENKIFKDKPSSVGGFLCDESQYYLLKKTLSNSLDIHNKEFHDSKLTREQIHFRVLHNGYDEYNDESPAYPKKPAGISLKHY